MFKPEHTLAAKVLCSYFSTLLSLFSSLLKVLPCPLHFPLLNHPIFGLSYHSYQGMISVPNWDRRSSGQPDIVTSSLMIVWWTTRKEKKNNILFVYLCKYLPCIYSGVQSPETTLNLWAGFIYLKFKINGKLWKSKIFKTNEVNVDLSECWNIYLFNSQDSVQRFLALFKRKQICANDHVNNIVQKGQSSSCLISSTEACVQRTLLWTGSKCIIRFWTNFESVPAPVQRH